MIENGKWTQVPGTREVQIYPLIRQPSILCSNSFILATSSQITVMDPGADTLQIAEIGKVLTSLLAEASRPVFVYLSHCHIDHFFAVPFLLEADLGARLICHAEGARVLNRRDRAVTVSDLHALDVPACSVWAGIFGPEEPVEASPSAYHPFEEMFQTERVEIQAGFSVPTVQVAVNGHDRMEIFQTPGHSPDGVSFLVGKYLFVGDLPFATDIGVAGAVGWDPEALDETLNLLRWLGRNREIEWVVPGHGKPFSFDQFEKITHRQERQLKTLSDLIPMDRQRLLDLLDYAGIVLDEISVLFAVVSARLLKTAHWLEILDEKDEAGNIQNAIDLPAVERLIDDFHYFVEDFKGKELKNVILVRALHFMARFDKTFSPESVSYLMNPLLLRRIKTLFSEFYHATYGFRFVLPEEGFDLSEAVEEVVSKAREPLFSDQAVLEATGAGETFLKALASRIAEHPLFEGVQFDLDPSCRQAAQVQMDRAVFQDLLLILFERIAVRGFERIELVSGETSGRSWLRISAATSPETAPLEGRQLRIIQRTMQNHGGDFQEQQDRSHSRFVFEFPGSSGSDQGNGLI